MMKAPPLKIPFFKPHITGEEQVYLNQATASLHWHGDGPFSNRCSDLLHQITGVPVYLTPSGSSALDLSLMALNLSRGSEVILPSFTFASTANCVVNMGLKPVFVDIRFDTLNIDERLIEQAITPATRAILVVHYSGVGAEMQTILDIARKYDLKVIEDAAQGIGASYKNRPLGTLGDLGIFSFHQTKNISCGEGGAILMANPVYREPLEIHRQKGTDRGRFTRGEVNNYSWIDRGSNYLLSDLLAAFLYAQLLHLEETTHRRKIQHQYYRERLATLASPKLNLPVIPLHCQSNYHIFYLLVDTRENKEKLIQYMGTQGIEIATHFVPLHSSHGGRKFGITRSSMEVTDRVADGLIRLPLYPQMTSESQDAVIEALKSFFSRS